MESGDYMNNLMKPIMDVVRHFTGETGELSFNEAVNALNKLKPNGFTASRLDWSKNNDLNIFVTPGLYKAWLKPLKHSPLDGKDQGSLLFIFSDGTWTKLGGVISLPLVAYASERRCAA